MYLKAYGPSFTFKPWYSSNQGQDFVWKIKSPLINRQQGLLFIKIKRSRIPGADSILSDLFSLKSLFSISRKGRDCTWRGLYPICSFFFKMIFIHLQKKKGSHLTRTLAKPINKSFARVGTARGALAHLRTWALLLKTTFRYCWDICYKTTFWYCWAI